MDTTASGEGAVYVYDRVTDAVPGTYSEQVIFHEGVSDPGGDGFGVSVAVTDDGNQIIAGAYLSEGTGGGFRAGAVYETNREEGGAFLSPAQLIPGSADGGAIDQTGFNVALSDDGSVKVLGGAGSRDVYVQHPMGVDALQRIQNNSGDSNDRFGDAIAVSGDGTVLAIGAYDLNEQNGSIPDVGGVLIYSFNDQAGRFVLSEIVQPSVLVGKNADFGWAISLSTDGSTLVATAQQYDSSTALNTGEQSYVFTRDAQGDYQLAATLTVPVAVQNDTWGQEAAVSGDGTTVVVTSRSADVTDPETNLSLNQAGGAYVFRKQEDGTWADADGNAYGVDGDTGEPAQGPLIDTVTGQLEITDADAGDEAFQPIVDGAGVYGTFQVAADGSWSYTMDHSLPAVQALSVDESLVDSIDVLSKDGSATRTVEVSIEGTNDAPTIEPNFQTGVFEDSSVTIDLADLADDPDSENDGSNLDYNVRLIGNGSFEVNGSELTYTPGEDFQFIPADFPPEFVEFEVTATDAQGVSTAAGRIEVFINGQDDEPAFAGDTSGTVIEDNVIEDPDNPDQQLVVTTVSGQLVVTDPDLFESGVQPLEESTDYGDFSIDSTGAWTFTIDNDSDSVQSLADGQEHTETFRVRSLDNSPQNIVITITGSNDAPTELENEFTTLEDQVAFFDVVAEDVDTDDELTIIAGEAENGTIENVNGQLRYTPDADFNGTDTFTYTIDDSNGGLTVGTGSVDVTAVNDAPVLTTGPVSAVFFGGSAPYSVADPQSFTAISDAIADTGEFTLELWVKRTSDDTSYTLLSTGTEGDGGLNITIGDDGEVNVRAGSFSLNSAAGALPLDEWTFLSVNLNPVANNGFIGINGLTVDSHTTSLDIPAFDYLELFGSSSDGSGFTGEVADIRIWNEKRDAVESFNDSARIVPSNSDGLVANWLMSEKDNNEGFVDVVNGAVLGYTSYDSVASAGGAVVDGYEPTVLEDGTVGINFNLSDVDAEPSDNINLFIGVNSVLGEDPQTGFEVEVLNGTVSIPDMYIPENGPFGIEYIDEGFVLFGQFSEIANVLRFVEFAPNPDFNGTVTISAAVADNGNNGLHPLLADDDDTNDPFEDELQNGLIGELSVQVDVISVNDDPLADADSATTTEDNAITIDVLDGDTDVDELDILELTEVENGENGTTEIVDNKVVYTPNENFNGEDSFTYTVSDGNGGTAEETVTVMVTSTNDPAEITGDTEIEVVENTFAAVTGNLDHTDVDADNEDDVFTASTQIGTYGTLVFGPDGEWSYTLDEASDAVNDLNPDDVVQDVFTVSAEDGTTEELTFNITGAADKPASVTVLSGDNNTVNISELGDQGNVRVAIELPQGLSVGSFIKLDYTYAAGATGSDQYEVSGVSDGVVTFVDGASVDTNNDESLEVAVPVPATEADTLTVSASVVVGGNESESVTSSAVVDVIAPEAVAETGSIDENPTQDLVLLTLAGSDTGGELDHQLTGNADGAFALVPTQEGGVALVVADPEAFDAEAFAEGETLDAEITSRDVAGNVTVTTHAVTVNNVNDRPEIIASDGNVFAATYTEREDGSANENDTAGFGSFGNVVLYTDQDSADGHSSTVSVASTTSTVPLLGQFLAGVTPVQDGQGTINWSFFVFDPAQMDIIDGLPEGETIVQVFNVTVSDSSQSDTGDLVVPITVTITGTNDAPVVNAELSDTAASLTELADTTGSDVTRSLEGTIHFSDVDLDAHDAGEPAPDMHAVETAEVSAVITRDGGEVGGIQIPYTFEAGSVGNGDAAGEFSVGWTFEVDDSALDVLAEGDVLTIVQRVTIDDQSGADNNTAEQLVTITITGANDTPAVVALTGSAGEDGPAINLVPEFTDPDDGDSHSITLDTSGTAGTVSLVAGTESNGNSAFTADTVFDGSADIAGFNLLAYSVNGGVRTEQTTGSGNYYATVANNSASINSDRDAATDLFVVDLGEGKIGFATVLEATNETLYLSVFENGSGFSANPDNTTAFHVREPFEASAGELGFVALEAADLPGQFLRHSGLQLRLDPISVDSNDTDKRDAAFLAIPESVDPANLFDSADEVGSDADEVSISYDPDGAFEALSQGETTTDTFTYTVTDSNGASAKETGTVTVTGVNDAPELDITTGMDAIEDGESVLLDLAQFGSDPDGDDDGESLTYAVNAQPAEGSAEIGPDGKSLVFRPGDAFQDLGLGETRDVTVEILATDIHGASTTDTVTITVTGTNDAPIILPAEDQQGTPFEGSVDEAEDGSPDEVAGEQHTASGTIAFSDADKANVADLHSVTFVSGDDEDEPVYVGKFALGDVDQGDNSFTWNFSVSDAVIDSLAANQVLTQTYEVRLQDDSGDADSDSVLTTVTITINGTNDAPVSADVTGDAEEDGGFILIAPDFDDVDLSDASFTISVDNSGTTGDAAVTSEGLLRYHPDGRFNSLAEGETATDTFTYTVRDATGAVSNVSQVTVTISGSNDTPTIVANTTHPEVLQERADDLAPDTASGSLSADGNWVERDENDDTPEIFSVSTSDGPVGDLEFDQQGDAVIDLTYGTLQLNRDGSYVYRLDNNRAATQELDEDSNVSEELTYVISNGGDDAADQATGTLTINIHGANDAPVVGALSAEVDEGSTADHLITAQFTDFDDDDVTFSVDTTGTRGQVTNNGDGTFTYNLNGAFEELADGEDATDIFTYTVSDGAGGVTSNSVTIVISGANDTPVITEEVIAADTVVEAGIDSETGTAVGNATVEGTLDNGNWNDVDANDPALLVASVANAEASTAQTAEDGALVIEGVYGTLTLQQNGDYSYMLDDSRDITQALNKGDEAQDVFSYVISNGEGEENSTSSMLTINITGSNDAPVAENDEGVVFDEDADDVEIDALGNDSDVDGDDEPGDEVFTIIDVSALATDSQGAPDQLVGDVTAENLGIQISGSNIKIEPTSFFDQLDADDEATVLVTYRITDSNGASDTAVVSFTVTGTNDAPVVTTDNAVVADLSEPDGLTASGTFNFEDDDTSDTASVTLADVTVKAGLSGGFALAGDIALADMMTLDSGVDPSVTDDQTLNWSFDGPASSFAYLPENETITLEYTFRVTDSAGEFDTFTVDLTITGTNAEPVIASSTTSATVTEAGGVENADVPGQTMVTGQLNPDGTNWSDDDAGEGLVEPGLPGSVFVTGLVAGALDELPPTPDYSVPGNEPAAFYEVEGTYGDLKVFADGTYEYTLVQDRAATEALSSTDTAAKDVFTYIIRNGTEADDHAFSLFVAVVAGTNDTPVITASGDNIAQTISESPEEGADDIAATGTLGLSDKDGDDLDLTVTVSSVAVADGSTTAGMTATIADLQALMGLRTPGVTDGSGENSVTASTALGVDWLFASEESLFDYLAAGESITLDYTITASDDEGAETTQVVSVTVDGTNDDPVVTVADPDAVTEGDSLVTSDDDEAVAPPEDNGDDIFVIDLLSGEVGEDDDTAIVSVSDADFSDTVSVGNIVISDETSEAVRTDIGYTAEQIASAFVVDQDAGTISFDRNALVFDRLDTGEQVSVRATFDVTSGDDTVTRSIVIAVDGENDRPYLLDLPDLPIGSIVEEQEVEAGVPNFLTFSTVIEYDDIELTDTHQVSVVAAPEENVTPAAVDYVGIPQAGFSSVATQDGIGRVNWNFFVNAADLEFLTEEQTIEQRYEIRISDGQDVFTQVFSLTITGTNDAPVIDGAASVLEGTATEANQEAPITTSGTIVVTDVDTDNDPAVLNANPDQPFQSNVQFVSAVHTRGEEALDTQPDEELGQVQVNGTTPADAVPGTFTFGWDFSIDGQKLDFLAEGDELTLAYDITFNDGSGADNSEVVERVTVVLTGTNDAPQIISGPASDTVNEVSEGEDAGPEPMLTASGSMVLSDVDSGDVHTVKVLPDVDLQASGNAAEVPDSVVQNADGYLSVTSPDENDEFGWTFSAEDGDFDELAVGQSISLVYTVEVTDSAGATATETVTITVTGSNDSPEILANSTGATPVVEDGGVDNGTEGTATTTGAANAQGEWNDIDTGDAANLRVQTVSSAVSGDKESVDPTDPGPDQQAFAEVQGKYGTLKLFSAGGYEYTLDNTLEATQGLDSDDAVEDVFSYSISDGNGGTASGEITINVEGANDNPVAANDGGASLFASENERTTPVTIDVLANDTDVDRSDAGVLTLDSILSVELSESSSPLAGFDTADLAGKGVSINNGQIEFLPTDLYEQLDANDDAILEITYQTSDDEGATATATATVRVQGANDAPVMVTGPIVADTLAEVKEAQDATANAGNLTTSGVFSFTDVDADDTFSISSGPTVQTSGSDGGLLSVDLASLMTFEFSETAEKTIDWSFDASEALFDYLATGQSVSIAYTVVVLDSAQETASQTVTITVDGANDAPAIADVITATGVVEEGGVDNGTEGTVSVSGSVGGDNWSDVDDGASTSITGAAAGESAETEELEFVEAADGTSSAAISGIYGTLSLSPDGSYTYTLDNDRAATQALGQDDSAVDVFTYDISDENGATATSTLRVNITGSNDTPQIGAETVSAQPVVEAGGINNGTAGVISTTGSLNVAGNWSDVDAGDDTGLSLVGASNATTEQSVTVANAPDGEGTLEGVYGSVTFFADGTYIYRLDDAKEATQALDSESEVQDTFTYTIRDVNGAETTSTLTVDVNGANDNPVASDDDFTATPVDADIDTAVSFDVLANDADDDASDANDAGVAEFFSLDSITGVTQSAGNTEALDGFDTTSVQDMGFGIDQATGRLTLLPGALFDQLDAGDEVTLEVGYEMSDDEGATSSAVAFVSVRGANDAPVFTDGPAAPDAPLSETSEPTDPGANAGNMEASGSLAFADIDTGDTHTANATLSGDLDAILAGQEDAIAEMFSVAVDGDTKQVNWTFTGDESVFDVLRLNDSVTLEYTIEIKDSGDATATQTVTLTVNGAADGPFIGEATVGNGVVEAGGVENTDLGTPEITGHLNENGENWMDLDFEDAFSLALTGFASGAEEDATLTPPVFMDHGGESQEVAVQGVYGTLYVSHFGAYRYVLDNTDDDTKTLDQDEAASDVFTYQVADGNGLTAASTVTINITGTNDAPQATPLDTVVSPEDAGEDGTFYFLQVLDENVTDEDDDGLFNPGPFTGVVLDFENLQLTGADTSFTAADINSSHLQLTNEVELRLAPGDLFDELDPGDTVTITLPYTISDSEGASVASTVSFSVTGSNDGPVIRSGDANFAATGERDEGDTDLSLSGQIVFSDVDKDDTPEISVVSSSAAASGFDEVVLTQAELDVFVSDGVENRLSLNADTGAWTYNMPASAMQYLPAGAVITVSYMLEVADDNGATVQQPLTITINGTNDAPVISADSAEINKSISEDGSDDEDGISLSGNVSVSDVDLESSATATVKSVSVLDGSTEAEIAIPNEVLLAMMQLQSDLAVDPASQTAVNASGDLGWHFAANTSEFQYLGTGESISLAYVIEVDDGNEGTDEVTVNVTITGDNDLPVIDLTSESVTHVESVDDNLEGGTRTPTRFATGSKIEDVDEAGVNGATLTISVRDALSTDHLEILEEGGLEVNDGVFSVYGDVFGTVTGYSTGNLVLTMNDANFATNTLSFFLSNLNYATSEDMPAGETATRTIDISFDDGSGSDNSEAVTQSVTVTIQASNDSPVAIDDALAVTQGSSNFLFLMGFAPGTPGQDFDPDGDALSVVSVTDVLDEDGDQSVTTAASAAVSMFPGVITTDFGANVQVLANGAVFYDASNANAFLTSLGAGQTAVDTFTYTISDGALTTTATASVTITGVNDLATAEDDTISVVEGIGEGTTGDLLANDVDPDTDDVMTIASVAGGDATVSQLGDVFLLTYDNGVQLRIEADGAYSFENIDAANTDGLNASFTYTLNDGDGADGRATVSLDITGENDAAVISGETAGTALEDSGEQVTGKLDVTDVDNPDTFNPATVVSVYGTFSIDAAGNWTYTLDDSNPDVDALVFGGTLQDTITVSSVDGTTEDVVITIQGANIGPVAQSDSFSVSETATNLSGNVLDDNGNGADSDLDGPALTVSAVNGGTIGTQFTLGSGALLTINADGTFEYDQNGIFDSLETGQSGVDSFTYTISDGLESDTAIVSITINGSSASVTEGDDVLTGSTGDEEADLGGGDDVYNADAGDDEVDGGEGDDFIIGGAGDDVLTGGTGNDLLEGGQDNDTFIANDGGDGVWADSRFMIAATVGHSSGSFDFRNISGQLQFNDVYDGGDGIDTLIGTSGNDVFNAFDTRFAPINANSDVNESRIIDVEIFNLGDGNDALNLGAKTTFGNSYDVAVTVDGGAGSDFLVLGTGDDIVVGGTGRDYIAGGLGSDMITGGADGDFFAFGDHDLAGVDTITDFEDGLDFIRVAGFNINSANFASELGTGITIAQDGLDTRITLVDDFTTEIVLKDVTATDIGVDDFLFAL